MATSSTPSASRTTVWRLRPFTVSLIGSNSSPYNPFVGTANDDPAVASTYQDNQLRSVAYRAIEGGLRQSFYDYDYWRYVAGFNGNFTFTGNNFISFLGYDTGMVYERGDYLRIDSGDFQRTPLEAEIAAGNFNPFRGLNAPTVGHGNDLHERCRQRGHSRHMTTPRRWSAPLTSAGRSSTRTTSSLTRRCSVTCSRTCIRAASGLTSVTSFATRGSKNIPDPTQAAGDQLGFNAAIRSATIRRLTPTSVSCRFL